MPATPQPKPSTLGGRQERELLSLGLFQPSVPPSPAPHSLSREIQENQLLQGTSLGLLEGVFYRHKDMRRVQVHLTARGRKPWAARVGGSVSDLSAPNPSFSAYLKSCLIFAEAAMSPAWFWP